VILRFSEQENQDVAVKLSGRCLICRLERDFEVRRILGYW